MALVFWSQKTVTINPKFLRGLWKGYAVSSSGTFSRVRGVWAPSHLQKWKEALEKGEVVAAPAEGVYGYSCSPFNEQAVMKLLSLKDRSIDKGLIVLCRHVKDVARFADLTGDYAEETIAAMNKYWPGPVTLVLPAKASAPGYITGYRDTVTVRIPSEMYMHEYLEKWGGPLVSTSLNTTGQPPARRKSQIPFGPVSLTLDKPLEGTSSGIFDVISGNWIR